MRNVLAGVSVAAGLALGGGVGLVAFGPGLASAQDGSGAPTTAAPPARPARSEHLRSRLGPLVSAGTITQAQADAVINALQESPGNGPMPGKGPRGPRLGLAEIGDAVAQALGMTPAELRSALGAGSTLGELAKSKNVPVTSVTDAIVKAVSERVDKAVHAGKLTQEQAAKIKADSAERAAEIINKGLAGAHRRPGGGTGGPGRPRGPGAGRR